jgi:DNA replication and repair protein RecF
MPLVSLELHNIRVYERTQLEPNQHLNLISGANASGKTTLLEAIHLLGTGRSFRTAQTEQLRRNGSSGLRVVGKLHKEGGETVRLGLTHDIDGRRVSINGLEQKLVSSLALHLPLQVISPDTHYDFQQSAKHRRGVLDWGLFHVEPGFSGLWTRYQRILHQRNAALKDHGQINARHAWDDELVETGEKLHAARAQLTAQLLPHYQACCQQLLGEKHRVDLVLESGWDGKEGFGESLRQDRARDRVRGFTHSGPQRADLQIILNMQTSRQGASHGQYKILVVALRLAQIRYLLETRNRNCCLLIDDLAAELDPEHRARLTKLLASLPVQVFVTTTESSLIDREYWSSHKTFHVEHGTVTG